MKQLLYNIAGGVVHRIRREKRTTISEVIVRGKRNIKQNGSWFYSRFSVESLSFIFNHVLISGETICSHYQRALSGF